MASATVRASLPAASLFSFPPRNDPQTLPAPVAGSTLTAPPFNIPDSIFQSALDVKVPITIACVYAVSVIALNAYNRSNGQKPWAISKTKAFFAFVIAHNVFLAVYSAWTFVGMYGALKRTLSGAEGLPGVVDSLCKIHGTSGLGNAISYNSTLAGWVSEAPSRIFLSDMGTPEPTDLGRLWNEGLAFYGWFFYLSKFYEVLDTIIILAKGKRSSTLQTYHHAGAMMCMWAGIRYMSPPIWMFVFVNSGIHAMMYTYYTLTALSVKVPQPIKRALTTMQIIQFLVGASYAALHSFVSYSIPVQIPIMAKVSSVASVASTAISSAVAAVATDAGIHSFLKKVLLRAAGEEGVAENVGAAQPATTEHAHPRWMDKIDHRDSAEQVRYETRYQTVPCVETSGQTFAIWLNVLYLAPLTVLFVRFFIKSYLRRTGQRSGKPERPESRHEAVEHASFDALKGIERRMEEDTTVNDHEAEELKKDLHSVKEAYTLKKDGQGKKGKGKN